MYGLLSKLSQSGIGRPSMKVSLKLFDSSVLPVLEYASEIWSSGKSIDGIS